jgi:hypothetical protein
MSAVERQNAPDGGELRERLMHHLDVPQRANTEAEAKKVVIELNHAEDTKQAKVKKTFGRTPDGTS